MFCLADGGHQLLSATDKLMHETHEQVKLNQLQKTHAEGCIRAMKVDSTPHVKPLNRESHQNKGVRFYFTYRRTTMSFTQSVLIVIEKG